MIVQIVVYLASLAIVLVAYRADVREGRGGK